MNGSLDSQHSNVEGISWPSLPTDLKNPQPHARAEHRISFTTPISRECPLTILCQAALAALLSRYTRADDVAYDIVLPTHDSTPIIRSCHSHVDTEQSRSDLMRNIQEQAAAVSRDGSRLPGANDAREESAEDTSAVENQTVLAVSNLEHLKAPNGRSDRAESFPPQTDRALLLECQFSAKSLSLIALYDPNVIDRPQIQRFLRQLGIVIEQFHGDHLNLPVHDINVLTREDREDIKSWNATPPPTGTGNIQDVIAGWATSSPDNAAVFAWDGDLTYSQLDDLSSRLALRIKAFNLAKESIIPLYFEKSKWTVVSMLAVLKAGAAFTLVDPSVPRDRVENICQQTSPKLALVCKSKGREMQGLVPDCFTVDEESVKSLQMAERGTLPISKPEDLAYIMFTSGSTGQPKGAMNEHRGITSFAPAMGPTLKIDQNSRILQFASYAYAVSVTEMFAPLCTGGCICIPSENDRMNDLVGFIQQSRATFMFITPSFVKSIQPESVPSLETLALVGEPMTPETRDIWAKRVHLMNAVGQSECLWTSIVTVDADEPDPRLIGRGSGTRLWITEVGNSDRLAPVGCAGELLIESCGRGRGYLHADEAATAKFVSKAPSWYPQGCEPNDSSMFYRTGDLACYRSDGSIVNIGREDTQVKIRGQRVELSGVEFQLRQIMPEGVTPIVEVVRRSNEAGREMLVAFIAQPHSHSSNEDPMSEASILDNDTASHFTKQLGTQMGRHAIPSYYVNLKTLPYTATGKTNRGRLRAIGTELLSDKDRSVASRSQDALPRGGPEVAMAQLWARSMSIDAGSITKDDNFFDLGGDSIMAVAIANKARGAGIPLKVADVLEHPVLSDLVATTSQQEPMHPSEGESIPVQPRHGDTAELSYAQRGLWFLEQLNPGTPAYNVSIAGRLRGPLQVDALMNALQALEQRHETLRTTFEQHNGAPVQVIQPCRTAKDTLQLINAATDADLHSALQQQQVAAFDLTSSPPWRVALLRVGADDHVLSIVMHHIISDGWSDDVLRRDLAKFYATAVAGHDLSKPLEPLPIQYRDFVAWQQSDAQQSRQQEQLQYWTKQLADSAPAELLLDMPRPKLPSGRAGNVEVTLERPLYQALQKFCNAQQTTTFVVLLAAFRATHYRLTGHEDATIGTPNASRSRSELEDLVGFFSNTQCIRIPVQDATFTTLVQQVKATVTAALAHQDVPFERVVSEVLGSKARDASRNPLVQILFAVHSQPSLGEIHLEGLSGEAMQGTESTRFDLEFHLVQRAEGIRGNVLFAKELFRPETMQAMVNTFQDVLRRGLVEPEASINALRLEDGLIELRNRGFLEVATTEYPRDSSIVDIFAQQVAASPQEPAAKDSSSQLTYAELDSLSDVLAAWLRQHDFPPESWVGVLAGRSCQTIVAFIGILKANLAYVPLDIDAPSSRVEGILSSFEGRKLILLGDGVETPDIPVDGLDFARLSDALDQEVDESKSRTKCLRPSAASLAYVMFTSGSTGKPKGVAIEHRGVVRLVKQTNVLSQLPKAMVVAHLFNIAFDLSVWEIYTALLNGGTIICIDATTKLDPRALEETFMREHIQAAMLPPVLLKTCLATSPKIFKDLLAFYNGADRFDSHDAALTKALMPQARVVNAYGPTENSALSTIYDVKQDDHLTNGVPIGEPISNSGAYVMDVNQNLVPIGVMGELVVTGDGLARGYTDPSLNKNVFVEVGIDSKQVRAYRTGDRVRRRPRDGQIEFFGRLDRQTKIRGYRIEMAEVEHAMLKQNEVNDAAIVLHQRDGEEADLIGFITTQDANDSGYEEETNGQVESWGRQFDNNFYNGIGDIDQSVLGSDFLGWTSMYSGEKIPRPEMQEWLDDIVQTMLDAQPAGRVLDLGTGTGMVLFNLGDGLENYVGLDPSKPAVTFATEKLKQVPGLADKAKVHVGAATDVGNIDSERSELVVLNSVVQYFPSPEYLSEVIDNIARLPHVKRLFIGDVRSYAINRQFLASRALYKLGEEASKNDIRQEMARLEDREEELLVSPTFFTSLRSQMPDLVEHVEILPKKMEATNELSSYRYSAVVHFKRANVPEQVIRGLDGHDWVDFKARGMNIESLTQLLKKSSDHTLVAISNMPYSKTIRERYIVETLDAEEEQDTSNDEDWPKKATQSAERCPSVDPVGLVALAEKTGFRVEINWARQSSQHGGLDAIFHHYEPPHEGARVNFRFPADDDGKPSKSTPLSNRPLQSLRNIQIEKRVRDALQRELPSYMVPRRVTVLESMPTNDNGKVDRKQLTKLAERTAVSKTTTSNVPPKNEDEQALCEEFSSVLGVDVGPTDDFFAMGGHSMMAMRLLPRVTDRLGWHILLQDLYQNSSPRALYDSQTSEMNGSAEASKWPSFMEVHEARGNQESLATLVLVHGFWGQGRIFAQLLPQLDERLDVIVLHDPFFGRVEGPQSLHEWSNFYLEELQKRLPRDSHVILGGYSFGCFTALQMASLWRKYFDVDPVSVALFDPAVWEPVNTDDLSEEFLEEKKAYGLRLFGEDQRAFVDEHFKKFGPLMASPREKPEYEGRILHIASSEVAAQGVPEWWAENYPGLQQECIDATHHGLFEWASASKQVGEVINEHCSKIWEGNDSLGRVVANGAAK